MVQCDNSITTYTHTWGGVRAERERKRKRKKDYDYELGEKKAPNSTQESSGKTSQRR